VKSARIICLTAAVLFLCACPASALIVINDMVCFTEFKNGLTHNIDYEIPCTIDVDYETPEMYTTVNVLDSGIIYNLYGHENSRINVSGGSIDNLNIYDSSQVNISGGEIDTLFSHDFSQVDISGGCLEGDIALCDQSVIGIFGYDFAVDGESIGFVELTSILGGMPPIEPDRHLTGTLLSGESIDTDFYIGHDAKIILIPEPATVLLLGLGASLLRKKR